LKIVVAGGGKVGGELCIDLAVEKHDVVIIDMDEQVVERLIGSADLTGIVGNGANLDLLREAGVPDCDVFIAVTTSDEINIIASTIAHKLGAKATLARVRNPEYSRNFEFIRENLGISLMVNPEFEAATAIARSIRFPSALGIETFADGRVQMVELRVVKGSSLVGMQLSDLRKIYGTVLVCVVNRGNDVFIPDGSFVLQAGDLIHVTGSINDLTVIYKAAGCFTKKIRSVMIVGGGRITRYLLKTVEHYGMDICVIDINASRAEELSGDFPKVKVIKGDGTDHTVLEEQHIGNYDCFIALTGIDEENLVTSLYAAKRSIPKIVTKVNR
jgi:trk system potassium uptake protein